MRINQRRASQPSQRQSASTPPRNTGRVDLEQYALETDRMRVRNERIVAASKRDEVRVQRMRAYTGRGWLLLALLCLLLRACGSFAACRDDSALALSSTCGARPTQLCPLKILLGCSGLRRVDGSGTPCGCITGVVAQATLALFGPRN